MAVFHHYWRPFIYRHSIEQWQNFRSKRFIGKVSKGFDFLGFHFNQTQGLSPSKTSWARLALAIRRLYEQGSDTGLIWQWCQNWRAWFLGKVGVRSFGIKITVNPNKIKEFYTK